MSISSEQIWSLIQQAKTSLKTNCVDSQGNQLFSNIDDPRNACVYNKSYITDKVSPLEVIEDTFLQLIIPQIESSGTVCLIIKELFDPTHGLPSNPTIGDIYLSELTINTWRKDYLYKWNGSIFEEQSPLDGLLIYNENTLILMIYDKTEWINISSGSSGVISVDGRTGIVSLSDKYAPLLHGVTPGAIVKAKDDISFEDAIKGSDYDTGIINGSNNDLAAKFFLDPVAKKLSVKISTDGMITWNDSGVNWDLS
jgi:hypothetical protein